MDLELEFRRLCVPFPLHHNGGWDLSCLLRLKTTSDFLYKIFIRACILNLYAMHAVKRLF